MKFSPLSWFRQVWPNPQKRMAALGEFASIGKFALADIALRGGVWSSLSRTPGDVFGDGINEGRRLLAIEIIELAGYDPRELYTLIERNTPSDNPTKERHP